MSRSRSRARCRRAREAESQKALLIQQRLFEAKIQELLAQVGPTTTFGQRADCTEEMIALFHVIAASDVPLWPLVTQFFPEVSCNKRVAEERMVWLTLIAEIVATELIPTARRTRKSSPKPPKQPPAEEFEGDQDNEAA